MPTSPRCADAKRGRHLGARRGRPLPLACHRQLLLGARAAGQEPLRRRHTHGHVDGAARRDDEATEAASTGFIERVAGRRHVYNDGLQTEPALLENHDWRRRIFAPRVSLRLRDPTPPVTRAPSSRSLGAPGACTRRDHLGLPRALTASSGASATRHVGRPNPWPGLGASDVRRTRRRLAHGQPPFSPSGRSTARRTTLGSPWMSRSADGTSEAHAPRAVAESGARFVHQMRLGTTMPMSAHLRPTSQPSTTATPARVNVQLSASITIQPRTCIR
jgi:hypothetical protein